MPDAFIWYHADEKDESKLINWLATVEQQAGVQGKLFVRKADNNTTFMEIYSDVSQATIDRIEKLAASTPLFEAIERRCENFVEII
ncbi:MAG: DUF4936 family protein [Mariprofundus sp.]|nr:DUF4936 family protein [Mariprofundus sp.]